MTAVSMMVHKGQILGYGKILNALDGLSLHLFGRFDEFILPSDHTVINSLFLDAESAHLLADYKNQDLDLLDNFTYIFTHLPHGFGL